MFSAAESLQDALKQLYLIDAIDENGAITSIGRKMAGTFLYILVLNF
jgi:HrpA-like RNA helicase